MTKQQTYKKFDLEERTAKFGIEVIRFCKKLPNNLLTQRLMPQLIASATSVGANYCEADDAESPKDFRHKIGICKKEARETKHWLRMIAEIVDSTNMVDEARHLWLEAKELNLIFNSIYIKLKNK